MAYAGQVVRGSLMPDGARLAAAVAAAVLWSGAALLLLTLPWLVRDGVLERQATGDGIALLPVGIALCGAGLLLVPAHLLSRRAHGTARPRLSLLLAFLDEPRTWVRAPRAVLVARGPTWAVFLVLVVVTDHLVSVEHAQCFRTCAPFPR